MTPEEALTKAAGIVSECGHTKDGRFTAKDGGVCAIGALALATGCGKQVDHYPGMDIDWGNDDSLMMQAGTLLAKHLDLRDHDALSIPEWNDNEASAEDVILAMKRAGHGHDS